jgi:anthranilate synthase component 1
VLREGRAHVHTGAGIVAGSVPDKEFEETEHKAAALRRAIEEAVQPAPARGGRPSDGRPSDSSQITAETPA